MNNTSKTIVMMLFLAYTKTFF